MSVWATTWAMHSDVPNPAHKLTLLALASQADDNDGVHVSEAELRRLAAQSPEEVHRSLAALASAGFLAATDAPEHYQLLVPDSMTRPSRRV